MRIVWIASALLLTLPAQEIKTPYPAMAPADQYMMQPAAEVAMARSAAPAAISQAAEIMVLGAHGYTIAARGSSGFVCMVLRSWTAGIDDPVFWNPKIRGPVCLNPPAAASFLPLVLKKTELALAGRTRAQIGAAITAAIARKELPPMAPGAMCFMLSKQAYVSDEAGHWHPHLMFFVPSAQTMLWGADAAGSPIISGPDPKEGMTTFMVPVKAWSDGTPDTPSKNGAMTPKQAHGTFAVNVLPGAPAPAEGLARFTMDKQLHGDLEGTSHGEMLSGGDPKLGAAGYVAIERVAGTLQGREGSFALQQSATMDRSGAKLTIVVVPGSGTGELAGIGGTFTIRQEGGQHFYDFAYTLPE